MALEPIRVARFDDLDRAKVQDEAIASATSNTEDHIRRYIQDPLSHGGRYVAADLFKETFPAFAKDPESRNRYNGPVHNAAAVLSAEQFRRRLADDRNPQQRLAVLLTGIPGAGKTTSVLRGGELPADVRVIFEGQLVRPETTIPKVEQVLEAGLAPVIVVAHAMPEDALRNTLRRFAVHGRGAGIGVMADIQAGLPAGLAAVRERFGDKVAFEIADYRDRAQARRLRGWENLPVLESEGDHERIRQRLQQELERLRSRGELNDAAERQALGRAPAARVRVVDGSSDRGDAPHGDRPGVSGRDRAQAFATLSRDDALARFPELSAAYEAMDALTVQLSQAGHSAAGQDAALKHATKTMVERLEAGQLPLARSSLLSRSPSREPESPDRDR